MSRTIAAEELISLLSDRPVAYHPQLAQILGGVEEAIFISQLLYWHGKGVREDGFIWKTEAEFNEETGLTRRNQETARKHLIALGVLEEKRAGVPARMHYKLNADRLTELIAQFGGSSQSSLAESANQECTDPPIKNGGSSQTIPETTQETTPQTTQRDNHDLSPDYLDLAVRTFRKTGGKASWTVTPEGGGADPWKDGPLQAFCELVKVSDLPPKIAGQWAKEIRAIADQWSASPEQTAQAIRQIPESEHKWQTFSAPFGKGFHSVLGIMLARVIEGEQALTAPTKVDPW